MNEVTIMTAGNYKIDLTALISLTDNKLIRTEIYKVVNFTFALQACF
jgi:hypothetical protein